jgi:hypothetical protein
MRKLPWYIYLIVVLVIGYSIALYMKPQETDWSPTLSNKDKIPYGSYVLFHELDTLMGYQPDMLRITPYEQCGDTSYIPNGEVYMFISPVTPFDKEDVNALLWYVQAGNDVFISSEYVGKELSDTLKLEIKGDMTMDSITTNLVNPALARPMPYAMPKGVINAYFDKFDTAKATVLGMNSKQKVNFILQPFGEGRIFINTVPGMFSNFSLLNHNNAGYVSASLSYLPEYPEGFYWDEYFKQGRVGEQTPLRMILKNPMLKAALYTALAAILLFMVFQSKRRQRIIPVVPPVSNTTVDFVETVSQVYYNQRNHRNIALKQVTYLFEHIRSTYYLDTSVPDDPFAAKLAHKTGMPQDEALRMMALIRMVRSEEQISDQHLLSLNTYIQDFHKYANQ